MPGRRHLLGNRGAAFMRWPSLAVLPFMGFGEATNHGYFTDGFAADVSDSISRVADIRVVPASSVMKFSGQSRHVKRIGVELGATYVLAGHIMMHDQALSFTQRLYDARTGKLRWTDVVQAGIDDLFDVQRHIIQRVVNGILPEVREAEIERALAKPPSRLDAYDLTLKALPAIRSLDRVGIDKSLAYLQEAMLLDDSYAAPHAWAARLHSLRYGQTWAQDRQRDGDAAIHHAQEAIRRDPKSSLALAVAGHLRSFLRGEYDTGLELLDKALEICPSDALAWAMSGATLTYVGETREAVTRTMFALKLSPFDQLAYQLNFYAGLALYADGRVDEAASYARLSLAENPRFVACHKLFVVSLAASRAHKEARAAGRELLRVDPTMARYDGSRSVFRDRRLHERFVRDMRRAGVGTSGREVSSDEGT